MSKRTAAPVEDCAILADLRPAPQVSEGPGPAGAAGQLRVARRASP